MHWRLLLKSTSMPLSKLHEPPTGAFLEALSSLEQAVREWSGKCGDWESEGKKRIEWKRRELEKWERPPQ